MITMPISGYLGTDADPEYFNLPRFSQTAVYLSIVEEKMGLSWDDYERPFDFYHKQIGGALLVWMLILLHAGAALYHHFVKHDDVLIRMLKGRDE